MSARLDEGDLDAALARVDWYTNGPKDLVLVCDCQVRIPVRYTHNLLDIVNSVAEHQPVCRLANPTPEQHPLEDPLCDALMAARHGKYDGLTVEQHLESLIRRVRGETT